MKAEANRNNDALRNDVNGKLKTLAEKIDTVKEEAKTKDDKNEKKMTGILERLNSIERNMRENKDKCEQDKVERKNQSERTKAFKEAVGLVDVVDKNVDPNREKTWSEIVDESREKEEERKEKTKQKVTKYWSKKFFVKDRNSANKERR